MNKPGGSGATVSVYYAQVSGVENPCDPGISGGLFTRSHAPISQFWHGNEVTSRRVV